MAFVVHTADALSKLQDFIRSVEGNHSRIHDNDMRNYSHKLKHLFMTLGEARRIRINNRESTRGRINDRLGMLEAERDSWDMLVEVGSCRALRSGQNLSRRDLERAHREMARKRTAEELSSCAGKLREAGSRILQRPWNQRHQVAAPTPPPQPQWAGFPNRFSYIIVNTGNHGGGGGGGGGGHVWTQPPSPQEPATRAEPSHPNHEVLIERLKTTQGLSQFGTALLGLLGG